MPATPTNTTNNSATRPEVVHLTVEKKDGQVLVTPSNNDRFVLKMKAAILGCQLALSFEDYQAKFRILLGRLADWLGKNEEVDGAWMALRDGQWVLVVMRNRVAYDRAFEDALSSLELEIAGDSDLGGISMSTMAVPKMSPECLGSLVDTTLGLCFTPPSRAKTR